MQKQLHSIKQNKTSEGSNNPLKNTSQKLITVKLIPLKQDIKRIVTNSTPDLVVIRIIKKNTSQVGIENIISIIEKKGHCDTFSTKDPWEIEP
jgi:hypothetical protein